MTLNGRNVILAEINKISGAHHKHFNEDRLILSAAKCRPMIVVSKNLRCVGWQSIVRAPLRQLSDGATNRCHMPIQPWPEQRAHETPCYCLIQNSWCTIDVVCSYKEFSSWCLELNLWYHEMNSWYRRWLHLTVSTVNAYQGSSTRVRSHSSLCILCLFLPIRLRWRWIIMTAVIESDYVITSLRQLCDLTGSF